MSNSSSSKKNYRLESSVCKPFELTENLKVYFEAIRRHMKSHADHLEYSRPRSSRIQDSTHSTLESPPTSPPTSTPTPPDDAQLEIQLVREMKVQFDLLDKALGLDSDGRNILEDKFESASTDLWSDNLAIVTQALEYVRCLCKDLHRYWVNLKDQLNPLMMSISRLFRLIYSKQVSKCTTEQTHDQVYHLLHLIDQLFTSLHTSPLVSPKINPESYSTIFESLIPFALNKSDFDQTFQAKLRTFMQNLFTVSEVKSPLLALLRLLNQNFIKFSKNPEDSGPTMQILTEWLEIIGKHLSETKVSCINLDSILNESDQLLRFYPETRYEVERDFRLLEAVREIVSKIVDFIGDPAIWDHLTLIDLDNSVVPRYIQTALDRKVLLSFEYLVTNSKTNNVSPCDDHRGNDRVFPHLVNRDLYAPIMAKSLPVSIRPILLWDLSPEDASCPTEVRLFQHSLITLASTSDLHEADTALDYLNQNFDDYALKFPEELAPKLYYLIQACTQQYFVFVIHHYPPTSSVRQPSELALRVFHANTSLLKRICLSSVIKPEFVSTKTLSELILMVFAFRLAWSVEFALPVITDLECAIFTSDNLSQSQMLCILLRFLSFHSLNWQKRLPHAVFDNIQRFAREMLYELAMPLQFATEELLDQMNLDTILFEVNQYLKTMPKKTLPKKIDKFISTNLLDPSARMEDNYSLTTVMYLVYDIAKCKGQNLAPILYNLKSRIGISGPLIEFLEQFPKNEENNIKLHLESLNQNSPPKSDKPNPITSCFNANNCVRGINSKLLPCIFRLRYSPGARLLCEITYLEQEIDTINRNFDQLVATCKTSNFAECLDKLISDCTFLADLIHKKPEKFAEVFMTIIGEFFMNALGKSDSIGHRFITESTLQYLLETNISNILANPYPRENLQYFVQWILDLQLSLTQYSHPHLLMMASMRIINKFVQHKNDQAFTQEDSYLFLKIVTNMLESSIGRAFYYPTIDGFKLFEEKFDYPGFIEQVNICITNYPLSLMESERDYKLLELSKRALDCIVTRRGPSILSYYLQDSKMDSPAIEYIDKRLSKFQYSETWEQDLLARLELQDSLVICDEDDEEFQHSKN